jgi:hypothetical protein
VVLVVLWPVWCGQLYDWPTSVRPPYAGRPHRTSRTVFYVDCGLLGLGDWSSYQCMTIANKIFQELGVPHHQGFSQDGRHDHCSFPADQQSEIEAFYNRFLLGQKNVSTDIFRTVGNWSYNATWVPWRVLKLI